MINHLNPVFRGWGNYYRHGASKRTFSYVDSEIYRAIWKWACRRHPNKSKKWIVGKYFQISSEGWKLKYTTLNRRGDAQPITLCKIYSTKIDRYIQVKGCNSPDDPNLIEYWENRKTSFGKKLLAKGSRLHQIANNQNWKCTECKDHLFNGEELQQHHKIHVKDGGLETVENLELIHQSCHMNKHSREKRA